MSLFILAHKRTVGSGSLLAKRLGAKCITPKRTMPLPVGSTLINFGVSSPPPWVATYGGEIINSFMSVGTAVSKIASLTQLQANNVPVPEFSDNFMDAMYMLEEGPQSHRKVFARTLDKGSQGEGIFICLDYKDVKRVALDHSIKLITRNYPKTKEFRVHVLGGKVIGIAQKRAMTKDKREEMGIEGEVNRYIRSYKNGWVFSNEIVDADLTPVYDVAIHAVKALGLTFGAVDVLAKGKGDLVLDPVVCEVNTAPALKGDTTIDNYVEAFGGYLNAV